MPERWEVLALDLARLVRGYPETVTRDDISDYAWGHCVDLAHDLLERIDAVDPLRQPRPSAQQEEKRGMRGNFLELETFVKHALQRAGLPMHGPVLRAYAPGEKQEWRPGLTVRMRGGSMRSRRVEVRALDLDDADAALRLDQAAVGLERIGFRVKRLDEPGRPVVVLGHVIPYDLAEEED